MEITTSYFEKIIMWQEFESLIVNETKNIKDKEKKIEEFEKSIFESLERLKRMEDEYKVKIIRNKELENELLEKEERIKKYQIELNNVKKNEEYKALLSDIEKLKAEKTIMEDEILKLMDEIEKDKNEIDKARKEQKEFEKEINDKILSLKEEIKKIGLYIEELKTNQQKIKDEIEDEKIKKRIENLIALKNHIAVVKANIRKNETIKAMPEEFFCSGCNMKLTTMDVLSIKKLNTFIICQNCSRLIYYK